MPPPRSAQRGARARREAADRALVARAQRDGTPAARAAAVEALLPLARSLARRYHRGEEPLDDLVQVASFGLLKAIDRFDLERGTSFASFAVPTIVGELRRHFRDKGWTIRVPRRMQELALKVVREDEVAAARLGRPPTAAELAARIGVSVEEVVEAREAFHAMRPASLDRPVAGDQDGAGDTVVDQLGGPDRGYERVDDVIAVRALMRSLSARQRLCVELRFRDDLTQAEIAAVVGVSQMHVSRILHRAMESLRARAEADPPALEEQLEDRRDDHDHQGDRGDDAEPGAAKAAT